MAATASSSLVFGGLMGAGDLLARNAQLYRHETGIVFGDVRLTWQAVNACANRFTNAMQKLGLQRGDRVALYARNSHQWVEALFGLMKMGVVVVTINYRLTAAEAGYIAENCGARALVCGATEIENARKVASQISNLKFLIGIGVEADDIAKDIESYETLVNIGDEREPSLDKPLGYDEPAMLLYTSGTTGFPKGAIYTHGSLLVGMLVHVHAIGSRYTNRVMLPSPLYSAGRHCRYLLRGVCRLADS